MTTSNGGTGSRYPYGHLVPVGQRIKGRLPAAARQILIRALDDPQGPYELAPFDRRVADALERVPRHEVPDLPDRIIAATAVALQMTLVSRDRRIQASIVETAW